MKFRNNVSILDQYTSGTLSKIVFYLLGIILLSVSSKISIPFFPVPMTLQTFVVYFIAASMGMVGFYSTISYVALGLMGLPIFAVGGGIAYIMSPTFGFLYGMILASFLIAYLSRNQFNKKIIRLFFAVSLGALIIFTCGIIHLSGYIGLEKALTAGLYPFIYSEFLKIALAILVSYLLIKKN
jgi:biotin transporter BioY